MDQAVKIDNICMEAKGYPVPKMVINHYLKRVVTCSSSKGRVPQRRA
jgi:hypothetical protein